MNDIPQRDLYGIPGDDILDCTSEEDAIGGWLDHYLLPGEEPPEELTITCANYVRDEKGEPVETEEEGVYEIKDRVEARINLREWCAKEKAQYLLDE